MRIEQYNLVQYDEMLNICLVKEDSFNCNNINAITQANDIYKIMCDKYLLNKKAEEYVYLLTTDTKGKHVKTFLIGKGTYNGCFVSIKDIMTRCLLANAAQIFLIHNHPSGEPTPSTEDIRLFKKLKSATEVLDLNVIDNIIIGKNFYSFRENNLI